MEHSTQDDHEPNGEKEKVTPKCDLCTKFCKMIGSALTIIWWPARKFFEFVRGKRDEILALFTALIFGSAMLQAWILFQSDETARLRDRAFVYFDLPSLTFYPAPNNLNLLAMSIVVFNSGNMPARQITMRYDCPDAPRVTYDAERTFDPYPLAKWKFGNVASVIGPKLHFELQACEIPGELVNQARAFQRSIFYLVEVQYIDGFDLKTWRKTQMSLVLRYDTNGEHSLGFVGPHNCSDDDCPK